jgi:GNAT superfamily N-acetyltransferase
MALEILELRPFDPAPSIPCDRGVSLVPVADRELHAPDLHLLATSRGSLVARCSCWWRDTPSLDGQRSGAIGHYGATDSDAGTRLLTRACDVLAAAGCTTAIGPLDGTTWRRYRFIVERGPEPVFFLEPDNPDDWPQHWSSAGFSSAATYTSAANDDLAAKDPRTAEALNRLAGRGIVIRTFDPGRADVELRRMFALSLVSFSGNFLYTPISEAEFLAQNNAVLPFVRSELVLLAEHDGALAGFMFALPDVLQARRGEAVTTVILKTIAVHPSMAGMGLGGVLMDLVQRSALELGFERAIHALMHETNVSRKISGRYARPIRRYALFSRALAGVR